jgi:hypothetical protein
MCLNSAIFLCGANFFQELNFTSGAAHVQQFHRSARLELLRKRAVMCWNSVRALREFFLPFAMVIVRLMLKRKLLACHTSTARCPMAVQLPFNISGARFFLFFALLTSPPKTPILPLHLRSYSSDGRGRLEVSYGDEQ